MIAMTEKQLIPSLTPELYCSNMDISLCFYTDILGFNIQYQRQDERFAMLERQGARLMLEEIRKTGHSWIMAPLEAPFGRGINLQIKTTHIDNLYNQILQHQVVIFLPMEEKWYQAGKVQISQRQFIVLDPDGYMLRFAQVLGEQE